MPGFGQLRPEVGASRAGVGEEWRVGGGCRALSGREEERGLPEAREAGLGGKVG